jgi:hypothetical protein
MAKALPVHLADKVTTELRLATRRTFTAPRVRRSLAPRKSCRVNIGRGKNPIQGWITDRSHISLESQMFGCEQETDRGEPFAVTVAFHRVMPALL